MFLTRRVFFTSTMTLIALVYSAYLIAFILGFGHLGVSPNIVQLTIDIYNQPKDVKVIVFTLVHYFC